MTNETMKDGERAAFNAIYDALTNDDVSNDLCRDDAWFIWQKARAASPQSGEKGDCAINQARHEAYAEGYADGKEYARAASPQAGEKLDQPVAWRAPNMSGSGDEWAYRDADDRFEDGHGNLVGEPLYTRAAAPQAALTDEQRATLLSCALRFEAEGNMPMAADIRALLTQAPTERMSEAAVDAAIEAWFDCDDSNVNDHQARMRRAIIAATKEYS